LNETFDGFADKFVTTLENGASGLNLSGLYNSLVDLGLSSEIAT
jgi:hypothetical protein